MSQIEVRIIKLESMRMLSSYGYGPNPESIAWDKLIAFCLYGQITHPITEL